MEKVKLSIQNQKFPSQTATESEKESPEFGLAVGQAIQYEWFKGYDRGGSCRFYDQKAEFHKLRLYARGEQPTQKYKDTLAVDGDLSWINLDWAPVPIMPKFVDIIVNGMSDRLFKVKAYAQDAMSQASRSKYQDIIEGQMAAKPILEIIEQESGVNPFTMAPDDLPQSDEELSLYMQLNYKPAIEIAEEESINTLLDENNHVELRKRCDYDQTVLGISFMKHEFQRGAGVVASYVDPEDMVYSWNDNDPYLKEVFYYGESKGIPLSDLLKYDPNLTNTQLEEIQQNSSIWYQNYRDREAHLDDVLSGDMVPVLFFTYKTFKTFTYKKKTLEDGSVKYLEKDEDFNPPQGMMDDGKFEKVEKTIEVWYDGMMILGTNYLLQWELAKNMVRPKSATQHAIPKYIACSPRMYKGVIDSIVKRSIPLIDLAQLVHMKLQLVISKIVPDGVFIDADGLNEVDLGNGKKYNAGEALKLYFQTGSVVGRSYTTDGDFNQGKVPIKEINHNSGANKIQAMITSYNQYLDMLRGVTGINEARDGTQTDSRTLVGLQKMAALSSNTATKHILDASLYMLKSLAEAFSYRVADILEYSDFKDEFINKIGKYNVSILEEIKDLYIYDFGIFIEVEPDEEEKAELRENIQIALTQQDINLEDAIDIREVRNIKLANQLLKVKRIKKQEVLEKAEAQKQAIASQQQLQSQSLAAQAASKKIDEEAKAKIMVEKAIAGFKMKTMEKEAALKSKLMNQEAKINFKLQGITDQGIQQREDIKEQKKSERISQQNSEESELINQRTNNLKPKKFESNEDTLDGVGFDDVGP